MAGLKTYFAICENPPGKYRTLPDKIKKRTQSHVCGRISKKKSEERKDGKDRKGGGGEEGGVMRTY